MTAQETERIDTSEELHPGSRGRSTAAGKAYSRRLRRQQSVTQRLTTTGSPITAALTRVPFVALIILLLAGGIVGVLYLNTVSDATGLKASDSRRAQLDLNTQIEGANKDIADLKNPARLAAEAQALGLVPAGDVAILSVGANGVVSIIGTPTPVPMPAPAAPAVSPTTAPAAATGASIAAATTTAPVTTVARTTAPTSTPAKATTAVKTTAVKTTAGARAGTTAGAAPNAAAKPTTGGAPKSASAPAARTTIANSATAAATTPPKPTPPPTKPSPTKQTPTTGAGQ